MSLTPAERMILLRRLRRNNGGSAAMSAAVGIAVALVVLTPLLVVFGLFAAAGIGYAMLADELDQGLAKLENLHDRELFETTRIYDRNGTLLREVFVEGKRTYLPLDQIPSHVKEATIAVEDRSFYDNPGIEPTGIIRALRGELTGQPGLGGGSTITQQFVRHVAFSYEERVSRSYTRKAKEIILALILTKRYSKDQILEWYLNEIYYGNLSYGIEAASQTVFGKGAAELDLAEAAMLAGLPQLPGALDPLDPDPDAQGRVRHRQKTVLDLMVRAGYITQQEADAAAAEELVYTDGDEDLFLAPHFVVYVEDFLEQRLDPELLARGGLEITTTLDLSLQQLGERVVREHVEKLRDDHDLSNAALVAMEPRTGQILAMVGSADYWDDEIDGRVNVALRDRQPGSSIKPITYLTALERGLPTSTMLWDTRMELQLVLGEEPWEPKNYDDEFHGPVRLRDALANSYNIPALKLLAKIPPVAEAEDEELFAAYMADLSANYPDGLDPAGNPVEVLAGVDLTVATAHRMGITGLNLYPWHYGLSLTLGGGDVTLLDMTTAYATLANMGGRMQPNPILRIADSAGNVLYDLADDEQALTLHEAADPRAAYIITDILSDNEARLPAFGPSNPLEIGVPAAVKTGTSNHPETGNPLDNWTLGYTPYLVTGVWAGNNDNTELRHSSGVTGAAPIWNAFMRNVAADPDNRSIVEQALADVGFELETKFEEPEDIAQAQVCDLASLNQLGSTCLSYRDEIFIPETQPLTTTVGVMPGGAEGELQMGQETAARVVPKLQAPGTGLRVGPDGQLIEVGPATEEEGPRTDDWSIVNAVVVPLPGPPPEVVAQAAEAGEELHWPSALLCLPGGDGFGMDKAQPVAVVQLPRQDPFSMQVQEESVYVVEWARQHGWSALEPTEMCTPENVSAALERGALPGYGTDVFALGAGAGPLVTHSEYRLNLSPGAELSARTTLTGTVVYDPNDIEYFKVELGRGREPREWITLGDIHHGPVVDGPLEVLDALSLAPDYYIVRLVLVKKDGNFLNPPYSVPIRIVP
jgi:membrane peptidoglycan carboxypeptidase